MAQAEGFYCTRCETYHGETGNDKELCDCGGPKEYREWRWCAGCGDEELTADADWNCKDECDLKGHNHD